MSDFLSQVYYGNALSVYFTVLGSFIIGLIIIYIFKRIVVKKLEKWSEKTETTIDDFIVRGIEKTVVPLLYFSAFILAIKILVLPPKIERSIEIASVIIITFFILRSITAILRFSLDSYLRKKAGPEGDIENRRKQMKGILTIVNILIWIVGLMFVLDNLGFKISAAIAGLGIGGIAIALAAQTILGDLFSYFVIFFDRPFEIGDFLIVGDKVGSVEYIGIKSTRIRSLSGEQLVFSNTDLVNSRVHNYKKMERRRVVFKLGVIYQTKAKQLAEIPPLVKNIIEEQKDVTFDRGHFASYGDFSLNFEFVYYVLSADYVKYMDIQQAINLKIYEEFETRGIEFAYPTQTLFMNKEENSVQSEVVKK